MIVNLAVATRSTYFMYLLQLKQGMKAKVFNKLSFGLVELVQARFLEDITCKETFRASLILKIMVY